MTEEIISLEASPQIKGGRGQRKSSSLPNETVEYLKAWMMSPEHIAHPYPTEQEKAHIMADTGIELKQLTNWFVNNRKRYWKPRVEARLHQQAHAAASAAQAHAAAVAAVAAAVVHRNPVTPDVSFKPALTLQPPSNGFVSFDLSPAQTQEKLMTLPLVGTDFSCLLKARDGPPAVRAVSETSSSISVSASEGDSDSSPEDDCSQGYSSQSSTTEVMHEDRPSDVDMLREDTTSTQGATEEPKPALLKKREHEDEQCFPSPRQKFRRVSVDLWRDSCHRASSFYDESLPTLEEASRLFGIIP
jgi:hypothetical protein